MFSLNAEQVVPRASLSRIENMRVQFVSTLLILILHVGYGFISLTTLSSLTKSKSQSTCKTSSTWRIFADAGNEADGQQDSSGSSDILNSPAFLRRKLEVLQNDIAKVEAQAEETQAQIDKGKIEWGPQLEALQEEVRGDKDFQGA